jgi:hypothetical protein
MPFADCDFEPLRTLALPLEPSADAARVRNRLHDRSPVRSDFPAAAFLLCGTAAGADQHYSDEVFFDTGLATASYHYSSGQASGPSRIALIDGKLPLTGARFISGPNALRLSWTSAKGGNWSA